MKLSEECMWEAWGGQTHCTSPGMQPQDRISTVSLSYTHRRP